jgi:hypothetical protein
MNASARRLREHALLSLAFVCTRAALHALGLRFHLDLRWMFLADPFDLRERLLESVWYFHAFPPGMNLLTGLLLKLAPAHVGALASLVFKLSGLVLVNAFFRLCRVAGLSTRAAFLLALAFCLAPASLFFEQLYLYTYLVACLLCLACVLFHGACQRGSTRAWFWFFLVCCAIGWLRSTFHLLWFVGMILVSVLLNRERVRPILLGALGPALLLFALHAKNLALFGVFGSSSWLPSNLTQATVARLPPELRQEWQAQGKLSPFANISVFAPPSSYLEYFPNRDRESQAPELERLERPSVHAPNYNHWLLLEVNQRRLRDARVYLRERPFDYARTVFENVVQMFSPSTEWYPIQGAVSPHHEHRKVLGGYETVYNQLVHQTFAAPVGFYVLLPLVLFLALRRARGLSRSWSSAAAARGHLVYFCAAQIIFVVAVSSLATRGEASRFRYQIEAPIWLLTVFAVGSIRRRSGARAELSEGRSEREAEAQAAP